MFSFKARLRPRSAWALASCSSAMPFLLVVRLGFMLSDLIRATLLMSSKKQIESDGLVKPPKVYKAELDRTDNRASV